MCSMKLPANLGRLLSLIVLVAFTTSCASFVDLCTGGYHRTTGLNSNPSGAKVTVYDKKGAVVFSSTTPTQIKLKPHAGYMSGARYRIVFEMESYASHEVQIRAGIKGWYIANIAAGGLIGFLIVNPLTGSMYTLHPKDVNVSLTPQHARLTTTDGSLVILLKDEVPASIMGRAIPLPVQ